LPDDDAIATARRHNKRKLFGQLHGCCFDVFESRQNSNLVLVGSQDVGSVTESQKFGDSEVRNEAGRRRVDADVDTVCRGSSNQSHNGFTFGLINNGVAGEVQVIGNGDEVLWNRIEVKDDVRTSVRQHRSRVALDDDDNCSRGTFCVALKVRLDVKLL
jgi:hypothetical protein